jgi:hypothetical protein
MSKFSTKKKRSNKSNKYLKILLFTFFYETLVVSDQNQQKNNIFEVKNFWPKNQKFGP